MVTRSTQVDNLKWANWVRERTKKLVRGLEFWSIWISEFADCESGNHFNIELSERSSLYGF